MSDSLMSRLSEIFQCVVAFLQLFIVIYSIHKWKKQKRAEIAADKCREILKILVSLRTYWMSLIGNTASCRPSLKKVFDRTRDSVEGFELFLNYPQVYGIIEGNSKEKIFDVKEWHEQNRNRAEIFLNHESKGLCMRTFLEEELYKNPPRELADSVKKIKDRYGDNKDESIRDIFKLYEKNH